MRIAIPQYEGTVSGAYELSKKVSIHLLDFQESKSHDEGLYDFPGVANAVEWLTEREVNAILVGTIDPDNADLLADARISVFTGADDLDPTENVARFLTLMGEAIARRAQAGCCGGGCHGEAEGSEEGCCSEGEGCDCQEGEADHECCGGAGHEDPDHVCKCH